MPEFAVIERGHVQPRWYRGVDRSTAISDEGLAATAPEKAQEIALRRSLALSEIEPICFERTSLLTPGGGAVKTYRLLAQSMEVAVRAG